jgi:flagellar brake protein
MQTQDDTRLENWHDYEVDSRREIVALLRAIGDKNQLIRMLVHGEADVCVTSILDVDPDRNTVYFDCSIDPEQNRRILQSKRLQYETTLDKIRILFSTEGQMQSTTHNGGPALVAEIPPTLIRLQRREFYRMATPVSNPVRAPSSRCRRNWEEAAPSCRWPTSAAAASPSSTTSWCWAVPWA